MEHARWLTAAPGACLAFAAGPAAASGANASAEQATAMVEKGVPVIKANCRDKGRADSSSKSRQFEDRDLDLVVCGPDGMVHAHGANEEMVGRNLIDLENVDGRLFVEARVELGRTKEPSWPDYRLTNPVSMKIEPKAMYGERLEETVVRGGIYTN